MKLFSTLIPLALASFAVIGCSHTQDDVPVLDAPYLGQKLPGSTPELFAPGIVNTEEHREVEGMFAPDMKAFYFIKRLLREDAAANVLVVITWANKELNSSSAIRLSGARGRWQRYQLNRGPSNIEHKNGQWQESVVKEGVSEPSISPDGKTIHLKKNYMERTDAGWSELKGLGAPFEDIDIMRLSASSNGTYYFDTFTEELDAPLRYSRVIDGQHEEPKSLGPQFATGTYNAHPFIAPDESYVMWDSRREGGYGSSDLYISYRATDGSWGPAINLGDKINSADAENYPSVSPDGKVLFFDRRTTSGDNERVDIYWVDAQFIETLRPKS